MADQESPTATHNSPRTWLLTASLSPLAVRLIRQLLSHGDCVAACFPPLEIEHEERSAEFRELINECTSGRKDREGWKDRIRGIRCDGRTMSGCGAAVAEAVDVFGRIDILLCCRSEGMTKYCFLHQPIHLSITCMVERRRRRTIMLLLMSKFMLLTTGLGRHR